ncbi:MAG: HAD hydrolase-like protein [Opitutales bacterium]|nr:HAD hydrolase-like protein [Opitutales bacterium]
MKYSHIIWDWNGTIINDACICVEIVNELLEEFKLRPVTIEDYFNNFSFPVKSYYSRLGLPIDSISYKSLSEKFIVNYRKKFPTCKLQKGVRNCFHYFKKNSIKQSVLSAGNQIDLNDFISFHLLTPFFDFASGVDDVFAHGKKELAKHHFDKIGLPTSEVLLIGDTLHDAEVAAELGLNCILFSGGHNSKELLLKSSCPVIESFAEVSSWVQD